MEKEEQKPASLKKIAIVASIGIGIQFGWALQFSLLTPYVQLIGIPHKWTSFIWLCGPVSGMIVQPIVGYQSDKSHSRWGRRRPFIAIGTLLVLVAIFFISFAADFGRMLGDSLGSKVKPRAITIFVTGFWIFDIGNNTLQAPCRAFLADLAGKDQQRTRNAYALFAFFLAVGSILGYAAGSVSHLYRFLPFTKTVACDTDCANLKTCFFISATILLTFVIVALTFVPDKPLTECNDKEEKKVGEEEKSGSITSAWTALQELPKPMRILVLVMMLNWMAWCPFKLYDTDWMGRDVYGGEVGGRRYSAGVHAGALGLMLNSIVLGCTCLAVEFFIQKVGGIRKLWGCVNFFLAVCMGLTVLIAKLAESSRSGGDEGNQSHPPLGIRVSALALFAALGVPLGVTFSIPYAMASIFSNSCGAGQGLTIGVLNLGIVIPQIFVSLTSGPWDALFGGGNLPSFVVGAFAAAMSGIVVLTMLPSPAPEVPVNIIVEIES